MTKELLALLLFIPLVGTLWVVFIALLYTVWQTIQEIKEAKEINDE